MATETENMDVDFCRKYIAKLQEKVILSANGQCQLWTGCRKGKFSEYGVISKVHVAIQGISMQ